MIKIIAMVSAWTATPLVGNSGSIVTLERGQHALILNNDFTYYWRWNAPASVTDVLLDDLGAITVTGRFAGADVDFDPGTGVDLKSSVGQRNDGFVTRFLP